MDESSKRQCPQCQTDIPIYADYPTWCDQCGWNLYPQQPEPSRTIFETLYISMSQKHGQTLFEEMVKTQTPKPALTLSKVLAISFAAIVHGITLICAILGVLLLIRGWPNPVTLLAGLLCLGLAWVLFPRLPKLQGEVVSRAEFGALYDLTDKVAQLLNTSPVKGIVIDWQFNASFSEVGWQRQKILYLGLPLFSILKAQEKVALLAHELAHSVNRDPNRSFFVGSAVASLISWYGFLRPDALMTPGATGLLALASIPLNLFLLGLANLVRVAAYGLIHLLWRDSQRAEYLADYLAADAGGTEAMLTMLHKLQLSRVFAQKVQSISLAQDDRNLFDELQQYVTNMPERELERLKRIAQVREFPLDTTHPLTAYRVGFLNVHYVNQPKLVLLPKDADQLDKELASMQARIQKRLTNLYKDSLYY